MKPLRIGVLGAARIAPTALIAPARSMEGVEIAGVAARQPDRAAAFARRHRIAGVYPSYEALIADPAIDAVYNPLPNSLHGRWTIAALEAGKHVLCEKPFTANAQEAEAVAAVARRTGLIVMEAFHYRYHALVARALSIIASGELGDVRHIAATFRFHLPGKDDIRWRLPLGGGATMDAGCYAIHMVRTLAAAEPTVRTARAKLHSPGVDQLMQAELDFADGRTGAVTAAMRGWPLFAIAARVEGTAGTLRIANFVMPHLWNRLTIETQAGRRKERVASHPSSYAAQLAAFLTAVRTGVPPITDVNDAIANMRVIDACYAAAGLEPRAPFAS